jgi:hypothetical protein
MTPRRFGTPTALIIVPAAAELSLDAVATLDLVDVAGQMKR